jgi:hypothetical protein
VDRCTVDVGADRSQDLNREHYSPIHSAGVPSEAFRGVPGAVPSRPVRVSVRAAPRDRPIYGVSTYLW